MGLPACVQLRLPRWGNTRWLSLTCKEERMASASSDNSGFHRPLCHLVNGPLSLYLMSCGLAVPWLGFNTHRILACISCGFRVTGVPIPNNPGQHTVWPAPFSFGSLSALGVVGCIFGKKRTTVPDSVSARLLSNSSTLDATSFHKTSQPWKGWGAQVTV